MNVYFRNIFAVLVSLICCISANGYDFVAGGIYYSKTSGTEVEVSCKDMADNTKAYAGNVVVPAEVVHGGTTYKVTGVGQMAFYTCAQLTSVTLPQSITSIGMLSFGFCSKLVSVNIPESVREVGLGAFYRCEALIGEFVLPEGMTTIDKGMFEGCGKVTSVKLPSTLTMINETAFKGCTSLTSMEIPQGVKSIMYEAFSGCTSLASISIPSSIEYVDEEAFENCPNLMVMDGSSAAFAYDFAVNKIYYRRLSDSEVEVTFLDEHNNDNAYAGNVVIPKSVNYNGVAYKVVAIGDRAFQMCWQLTGVTIPSSVTRIGEYAFNGCIKMKTLQIPASVKQLGCEAFGGCTELSGTVTIPEGVKKIEVGLFDFCEKLTAVQLPSTITSIESNAFSDCHSLKSIVIPNKVKSIGVFAFARCEALKTINIPDGLEIIDDQAFRESGLTTVTIPVSVTQIHPRSFEDCKYLGENHANVILLDKSHKGQINGYEWVDLGLPSGLKWASCNVGASAPQQYGGFFMWGETQPKTEFKRRTVDPYGPRYSAIEGNPEKDAATANWGASWRMPTIKEIRELVQNCRQEDAVMNGVRGVKFVSRTNFNFIFIPYAGYRVDKKSEYEGLRSYIWSSTPKKEATIRAHYYYFTPSTLGNSEEYHWMGYNIRPVSE